jgi:hypothetical protein
MIPEELFFINFPPNVLVIFRGHVFPVELTEKLRSLSVRHAFASYSMESLMRKLSCSSVE